MDKSYVKIPLNRYDELLEKEVHIKDFERHLGMTFLEARVEVSKIRKMILDEKSRKRKQRDENVKKMNETIK